MATESKTKPPEDQTKQLQFVKPQAYSDRSLPRLRDHTVDEWWLNVDYVSEGLCDKHDKKDKH
jgi:hypothetical protein